MSWTSNVPGLGRLQPPPLMPIKAPNTNAIYPPAWLDPCADFGAVGDGITDDSAALQRWLNTLSATRTPGVLPRGKNFYTQQLFPGSNTTIIGWGATLSKNPVAAGPILSNAYTGAPAAIENITIIGVNFVGEGQAYTPTSHRTAITLTNATNVWIEGCTANGFAYGGIELVNCQGPLRVLRNTLTDIAQASQSNAIHVQYVNNSAAVTNDVEIAGNTVEACDTIGICLQVWNNAGAVTYNARVHHNNLQVPGADAGVFLEINGGTAGNTTNSAIHGVTIDHNLIVSGAGGITVQDSSGGGTMSNSPTEFAYITIDHNIITSAATGVWCGASYAHVTDNNITVTGTAANCAAVWVGVPAPQTTVLEQDVIARNIISMPVNGIQAIFTTGNDHDVLDNSIIYQAGSSTSTAQGAIYIHGGDRNRAKGNRIEYAPQSGVYVNTATDFEVRDNYILNPGENHANGGTGGNGVTVVTSTATGAGANLIKGNTIIDNRAVTAMGLAVTADATSLPYTAFIDNLGLSATAAFGPGSGWKYMRGNSIGTGNYFGFGVTAIAPGGSPYTWTNTLGYPVIVTITGGAVTSITTKRLTQAAQVTGLTAGQFLLGENDVIIVTYTAAPTMSAQPTRLGG